MKKFVHYEIFVKNGIVKDLHSVNTKRGGEPNYHGVIATWMQNMADNNLKLQDNAAEKPFLEIEVVKLQDGNSSEREILDTVLKRYEKNSPFQARWVETDAHPKLRFDCSSLERFEAWYHRGVKFLDSVVAIIKQKGPEMEQILPSAIVTKADPRDKDVYLILKYTTNYKKPMRAKYEYILWFAKYFSELTDYEEVVDGFLHFYKRRIDFTNTNLDKFDPEDLRQWIQNKQFNISNDFLHQLLMLLPPKL
ncbi:MAG: hypothetical protein RBG13Loki_3929 [Promethearchaeota archaeon CR_4]|nr:MAG: hypothetical protein RBG13Loki_3929 [Candidatus Lokiarchaeota archaeon CR_4]